MSSLSKKRKREEQQSRKKRNIIIGICAGVVVIAAIATLIAVNVNRRSTERVYAGGNQTVVLRDNGFFIARLAHDTRTGDYSERTSDGVTIISFTYNGITAEGTIEGNFLNLPREWDDHHGHDMRLVRTR